MSQSHNANLKSRTKGKPQVKRHVSSCDRAILPMRLSRKSLEKKSRSYLGQEAKDTKSEGAVLSAQRLCLAARRSSFAR